MLPKPLLIAVGVVCAITLDFPAIDVAPNRADAQSLPEFRLQRQEPHLCADITSCSEVVALKKQVAKIYHDLARAQQEIEKMQQEMLSLRALVATTTKASRKVCVFLDGQYKDQIVEIAPAHADAHPESCRAMRRYVLTPSGSVRVRYGCLGPGGINVGNAEAWSEC